MSPTLITDRCGADELTFASFAPPRVVRLTFSPRMLQMEIPNGGCWKMHSNRFVTVQICCIEGWGMEAVTQEFVIGTGRWLAMGSLRFVDLRFLFVAFSR
jgi:hypothetical protein